ncbi:MAG TPA: MaoC family dehydratase [Polyangiaceae bacterium]|nr:MaoC family dehydratase [Polyangiaceae bacterium]
MTKGYRTPRYGRLLEEFEVGAVYPHPWEVTVDAGALALCAGSFLDATPVYASARFARALGFRDRPVHPLALLNFGLSFSVHDVSEQAIAHLAYIDVRFPNACYAGDTLRASSTVLGVKPSSEGARGVVHVRTVLGADGADGARVVCQFERKVLVKAGGTVLDRPAPPATPPSPHAAVMGRLPPQLGGSLDLRGCATGFAGFFEDFAPGDVICHDIGRTVSEAEHMQLTYLFRNTHPVHFEEPYALGGFAKTRVVYGGLVFGWIASLASRDTSGNVLWEAGFDKGAHPAGVVAGDTLYAASRVVSCVDSGRECGTVTFRLVGTKNVKPAALLDKGADLFSDELSKAGPEKVREKVFEIERTSLVRKRP